VTALPTPPSLTSPHRVTRTRPVLSQFSTTATKSYTEGYVTDEVRLGLATLARKHRYTKGHPLTKQQQAALTRDVVPLYTAGASIRELADATGRSYGAIHRLLATTEGVVMRGRGGARQQRTR